STSATPLSSTRSRAQTSMRGSAASHHWSLSSPMLIGRSSLQEYQHQYAHHAGQTEPAGDRGDIAQRTQAGIAQAGMAPAHQPPGVGPVAIAGAGGEGQAAVQLQAVGERAETGMGRAGGTRQAP